MLVCRFRCPHCGQAGKTANPLPVGRKIRCAACNTPFAVAVDRPGPVETFRDDLADDTSLPPLRRDRSVGPKRVVDEPESYRPVRRAAPPRRPPAGNSRATKLVFVGLLVLALAGGGVFLIIKGFKGESIFGIDNRKVTKENFEKLEAGMTLKEVEAILGSGTKSDLDDIDEAYGKDRGHGRIRAAVDMWRDNGQQAEVSQWYKWRNGDLSVFVGFAPTDKGEGAALSFWVEQIHVQGGRGYNSEPGIVTAGNVNSIIRERDKIARMIEEPRWKGGDRQKLIVGSWRKGITGYDFTADGTLKYFLGGPLDYETSYRFSDGEHVEWDQPVMQFPGMKPVPPRPRRVLVLVDQNELYLVDKSFRSPSLDGPYHRINTDGSGAGRTTVIDPLVQQLSDRDAAKRRDAALQLGALGSLAAPAVPALIARLRDNDEDVRGSVVGALGEIGPAAKAAVPEMIRLLRNTQFAVQHNVVMAIGKIGPDARAAVPDLVEMTRVPGLNPDAEAALNKIDPSGTLRVNPGPKLHVPDAGPAPARPAPSPTPPRPSPPPPMPKPPPPDPNSPPPGADEATQLDFWIKRLKDPEMSVRVRALDHLSGFGPKAASAIPTLIEFLRTGNIHEKARAARCLGGMGPLAKEAVPALQEVRKAAGIPAGFAENALQRIDPGALK